MNWRRLIYSSVALALMAAAVLAVSGYRSARLYRNANEVYSHIKYLVDTGTSIGTAPAESALSATYLEIIFGDDPELLEQLKVAVEKGMREMPDVQRGEVSAIIVTYRKNGDNQIEHVIAHIMGEFPLGRRQISMHRDGFFASQIDDHLWQTGDAAIRFLGREMVVWAYSEEDERAQRELIEAIFTGEIIVVAESVQDKPMYFTAVLPAPREILPIRMRRMVRALLFNGMISPDKGDMDVVVLTDSERAASRVASVIHDAKIAGQIALRTRFGGVMVESPWGEYVPVWWAYEMANTLEDAQMTRRDRTVSLSSNYGRRMVNAQLKSIERFGRDYSQIKAVKEEKLDPRVADARLQTGKPLHYWSEAHRWGPDWPFGTGTNIFIQRPTQPEESDSAPPVTELL